MSRTSKDNSPVFLEKLSAYLRLIRQMRQRGDVVEAGVGAIHDVLMVAVVACPKTVATVLKRRTALQPGRLQRLQGVKIRIIAVVDRPDDRCAYQHECQTKKDGLHRDSGTHRRVI